MGSRIYWDCAYTLGLIFARDVLLFDFKTFHSREAVLGLDITFSGVHSISDTISIRNISLVHRHTGEGTEPTRTAVVPLHNYLSAYPSFKPTDIGSIRIYAGIQGSTEYPPLHSECGMDGTG